MRSITITDSVLDSMATQRELVTLVPPLASIVKRSGCGCSGRNQKLTRPYLLCKAFIANAPADVISQLKSRFNVDKIVVYVKNSSGIEKKEL